MRTSILVGLGLALSVAGTAVAQQPQDGQRPPRGGERAGEMKGGRGGPDGLLLKDVNLTEGQRTQIAQLRKTQRDAMEANREKNRAQDRKSTRLNSSHSQISYAVFCLKKKKNKKAETRQHGRNT